MMNLHKAVGNVPCLLAALLRSSSVQICSPLTELTSVVRAARLT